MAVVGLAGVACDDEAVEQAGSTLFRLQPAECFNSPAVAAGRAVEVDDVTPVPCAEVHDAEVFAVLNHPAAPETPYPGDDPMADFAATECLLRFAPYTATSYDDSDLDVATVRPDEDSWEDRDDRQVACVVHRKGSPLTGSARKP